MSLVEISIEARNAHGLYYQSFVPYSIQKNNNDSPYSLREWDLVSRDEMNSQCWSHLALESPLAPSGYPL
jgi:hypothetical protein